MPSNCSFIYVSLFIIRYKCVTRYIYILWVIPIYL
nr:MAG TPA: hypothetical protein [Caudoviricetes sp.]